MLRPASRGFGFARGALRADTLSIPCLAVLFKLIPIPLLGAARRVAPRIKHAREVEYRTLEAQKPKARPHKERERHRIENIVVALLADERHRRLERMLQAARTRNETLLDQLLWHLEEQRNFPPYEQRGAAAGCDRDSEEDKFEVHEGRMTSER